MSLKSILATSAAGSIQKAFLIIHKTSSEEINSAKVLAAAQNALQAAAANAGAGALSQKLSGAGADAHVMQVQYNPSSLSIQASSEDQPIAYLQQHVNSKMINQNTCPPMVVLSVQLIFDAMNPQDAFMLDKVRLSAGKIVSDISGGIQAKKGGYTVQPQTEGLMTAMLQAGTRVVTFRWADMAFTGQLIEMAANYTMFSVSGKPIRSTITMNIAQQVESDADFQYWNKAIDKVFGQETSVELKGVAQKAGNILNLDLF